MSTKAAFIPNVFEQAQEVAGAAWEATARDVKKQTAKGLDRNLSQMLYGGVEAYKSEEEIERLKEMDLMMKDPLYNKHLREAEKLAGRNDPIATKHAQELQKKTTKNFQELKHNLRNEVKTPEGGSNSLEQERKQKKQQSDEEHKAKLAQKKEKMSQRVVAIGKKNNSRMQKRNLADNLEAPKEKKPDRTLENRGGQGIGG